MRNVALVVSVVVGLALTSACGSDSESGSASGGKDAGSTGGSSVGGSNSGGSGTGGAAGSAGSSSGGSSTGGTGGSSSGGTGGASTGGTGGSGTGGAGGGSGGFDCTNYLGVTADAACTSFGEGYCNRLAQCAAAQLGFASEAACATRFKELCLESASAPGLSIDPALYAAYGAFLKAMSCLEFYDFGTTGSSAGEPAGCSSPGSVADGKNCFVDGQCAGGACVIASDAVCGYCSTPAAGSSCLFDSDCGDPLRCDSGQCVARTAIGSTCASSFECVQGAYCNSSDVCAQKGGAGAACSGNSSCEPQLVCGANGQCKQPALGTLGASCDPTELKSCNVFMGFACNSSSNTCAQSYLPGPGDPCGVVTTDAGVVVSYFCSGGAQCIYGSGSQGVCTLPAADGAACNQSAGPHCLFPAKCINGTCTLASSTTCPPN